MWEKLFVDGRLARMTEDSPYGAVEAGALAIDQGKIAFVGNRSDLSGPPESLAKSVESLDGRWVTPGLIDCHTHVVYGGDRAQEFEMRLEGASYEELSRAGGGIASTVKATRLADEDTLFEKALRRCQVLMSEGVTTMEIKSGYGLDLENELKQLRVARRLGEELGITVKTSFLGAHALPPEFEGNQQGYIDSVVAMMPEVKKSGLADAVDAFCEGIGFTVAQTDQVFRAARAQSLPVKLHADQLSDLGGASLAARFGALSADHLEYTSEEGVYAMAASGTVAVLLPGAFYVLREKKLPPIDACRRAAVPIALSTDSNPGSSPVTSLLLMVSMGCTFFRLTPEEALAGVTRNAAKALGLIDSHGTLEVGKKADLCIWNIERPADLAYRVGDRPLERVILNGEG